MASTNDRPANIPVDDHFSGDITSILPPNKIWLGFGKFNKKFSNVLSVVGIIAVLALVLITVIDVLGSKIFNWPFPGFVGAIGTAQLLAMSFALAVTFFAGHHIKVELILNRYPGKPQAVISSVVNLLGFLLFVLIIWQMIVLGISFMESGEVLDAILFPLYPIVFAVALAFIPFCLGLFYEFGNAVYRITK